MPETIHEIPPEEVHVTEGRQRQRFPTREMDRLIASIKELGQIHPGVCRKNEEGKVELIVGERRLRACGYANNHFRYYLKEEVTDSYLLERIQLEENLIRHDLEWREEVAAKERLHILFQDKHGETQAGKRGGHGIGDTATHLGESSTSVQEDIALAAWVREVPEVAAAPNKTTAKKVVKRLLETMKKEDVLEKTLAQAKDAIPPSTAKIATKEEELPPVEDLSHFERKLLEFDRRCLLGRMENRLLEFKDESIDIVFFDPPWGVEYHEVRKKVYHQKEYNDDPQVFYESLMDWLVLIHTKMAENSHLFMFFGITSHEFVYDTLEDAGLIVSPEFVHNTLEEAGFITGRIPLIWFKEGARRTRNPEFEFGRAYEPIAFAWKGKKKLARPGHPNVIVTPQPTPTMKDIHPSAKHPEVYRRLLLASASPSNVVVDPMAGSGMMGVAAEDVRESLALDWWNIEVDSDYRNLQLFNLNKGFDVITKKEKEKKEEEPEPQVVEYRDPPPITGDFQTLTPGTPKWTEFWEANPDKQEEMLEWRKQQKNGR